MAAVLVSLDFSKAFDTVRHKLIEIFEKFFYSYFSSRKKKVTVGQESASLETISSGLPEGSIWGHFFKKIFFEKRV